MKIISNDRQQWYIHFYSDLYSMPLYQDFDSIKELCEYMGVKRDTFEIYKNIK